MSDDGTDHLKPLASADGQPVFEEAWQAEALAIADTLVRQGLFTASTWSETLGAALADAESRGEADTQETYYRCVVDALESLIAEHGGIARESMLQTRADWEAAYHRTPHGQPVILSED